jgi:transposase
MTIIAFDVGKSELVGVLCDKNGTAKETFTLENTSEIIENFLGNLKQKYPHLLIGSEATADYHNLLATKSIEHGYKFRLLNPILTKQFTRATVRKKKTDLSDAIIIARLLANGEGTDFTISSISPEKFINRSAYKLYKLYQALYLLTKRMRAVMPENIDVLAELDKSLSVLHESMENLQNMAQKKINPELKELLKSIVGIGDLTVTTFITEINDIHRFKNSKSLIAYAGLDPKVRQSGLLLKRNTKITKRGSPHLRRAAYLSAQVATRYDPELILYYQKKISEQKTHREAVIAVAKKLLYRLYAVWKRGTPYVKKYPQTQTID